MECDVFFYYSMKQHSNVTAKAYRALYVHAFVIDIICLCALDDCSLAFELVTDEWSKDSTLVLCHASQTEMYSVMTVHVIELRAYC